MSTLNNDGTPRKLPGVGRHNHKTNPQWLPLHGKLRDNFTDNFACFVIFCHDNKISVSRTLEIFFRRFINDPSLLDGLMDVKIVRCGIEFVASAADVAGNVHIGKGDTITEAVRNLEENIGDDVVFFTNNGE